MNIDWDKLAEDRFKSEMAEAKLSSHFALNVFLGIMGAMFLVAIDVASWFFFGQHPAKSEIWVLVILIVTYPICEMVYRPLVAARAMQAKRTIRIEAKLDYLLSKQSVE